MCKQVGHIEFHWVAYMNVFDVTEAIFKFQLLTPTNSHKSVGWGIWKSEFQVEIPKFPRWRHLYSHKQLIDSKYRYVPALWLAVGGGATDGPPHFVNTLNL